MCPRYAQASIFTLAVFFYLAISENKIEKRTLFLYVVYSFICPLAYLFLLNLGAKLRKLWHITKQFILNKVDLALYSLHFGRKCLILRM
jgi:hypothetical protein